MIDVLYVHVQYIPKLCVAKMLYPEILMYVCVMFPSHVYIQSVQTVPPNSPLSDAAP